jgi:hypothetical protein
MFERGMQRVGGVSVFLLSSLLSLSLVSYRTR